MANLNPGGEKAALYLEDLQVGQRFVSGTHRIDEEQIRAFAEQFDPQPFHLDPEAAKTTLRCNPWRRTTWQLPWPTLRWRRRPMAYWRWPGRRPGRSAAEHCLVVPAGRPPEPDGAVGAGRGDPLAVRAVDRRKDLRRVPVVGRLDRAAGAGVPLAHGAVVGGRHQP
jgi:hypothetical protein